MALLKMFSKLPARELVRRYGGSLGQREVQQRAAFFLRSVETVRIHDFSKTGALATVQQPAIQRTRRG